jgi:uncharacterized membrane protein (DUF4010 family)
VRLWLPVAIVLVLTALLACLSLIVRSKSASIPPPDNPADLKTALTFGALYALVLILVAWASDSLGNTGLYGVAALSGLTDMDAITLSSARMVSEGRIEASVGWRAILIGGVSNLLFKAGLLAALGGWSAIRRAAPAFTCIAVASIALVLLW